MGDAVTGGGLMGKDLSKADVSVNIACHLMAQAQRCTVTAMCSIGDERVVFNIGGREESFPYSVVVHKAAQYIEARGGFEKFAEWGLIRP
jgi:S-adenosylmethionine synthetase